MACPHCGKVPYPVRDENKKIIWKNVFKLDWFALIFVIILVFLVWAYKHDTAECFELVENTDEYCKNYYAIVQENQIQIPPENLEYLVNLTGQS